MPGSGSGQIRVEDMRWFGGLAEGDAVVIMLGDYW